MKLAGLYVDGWGVLRDFTLEDKDLGRGLGVIFGLNETGKTTLLSFIRAVLFGFKAGGAGYEPLRGGQPGGRLLLEEDGGVYRVERYGRGNGKVTVELPGGEQAGEEYLRARLLRGVGPVLFNNVFALGMEELRRLEDLQKDEISAYIYGAGTGASPRRLAAAAAELGKTADNLFRPRGRTREMNRLLHQLDQLDRKTKALEQQPHRYLELRNGLAELERLRDGLRDRLAAARRRVGRLDVLARMREPWLELGDCRLALRQRQEKRPPGDVAEKIELLEQAAAYLDKLNTLHGLGAEGRKRLEQLEEHLRRQKESLGQPGENKVNPWPALAALALLGGPGLWLAFRDIIPGLLLAGAGLALAALLYAVPAARAGERRRREEALREELARLEEERAGAGAQLSRLAQEQASLEEKVGRAALALTGEETMTREQIPALRRELLAERDQHRRAAELQRHLLHMAGSPGALGEIEPELASGADHAGELRELQTALNELEEQLQRLVEDMAAVKNEMAALETDEELARVRQQREMAGETLAESARRWQTAVLARALLELAREKHERERQPAVLALASEYIGPMTGGRYTRVVAPVGAARMLEVEEPGGRRVPARALSRGAAAQLYLSVRLALARHLGTVLTPMPVILDDVLVDFDAHRLGGALQVLIRSAGEQQVLLFTCHRHILAAVEEERKKAPGGGGALADLSVVKL
ncbi:MAG: AAA family ATPase [Firmicutes bacterium]|nr:AAA family ATPase [Bacillota bacterium]